MVQNLARDRLHVCLCFEGRRRLAVTKDTELDEDDNIFNDGAQGTDQPWKVCKEVFPLQRVEQDAGAVGGIAQERQDEEQQRQALARALFLVLDDLRNTGSQVAYGTDVSKNGGAEGGFGLYSRAIVFRCRKPNTGAPGDGPASCTYSAHTDDAQDILHPFVLVDFVDDQAGKAARAPPSGARIAAAPSAGLAAGQGYIGTITAAEKRLLDALLIAGRVLAGLLSVLDVVVHALGDEDQVCEAEVDGKCGNGGDELGPEGASEVSDVAYEPYGEEGERYAIGGGLAVVFNELRDLWMATQQSTLRVVYMVVVVVVVPESHGCTFPASAVHIGRGTIGSYSPGGRSTMRARYCRRHPTAPRGRSGPGCWRRWSRS